MAHLTVNTIRLCVELEHYNMMAHKMDDFMWKSVMNVGGFVV